MRAFHKAVASSAIAVSFLLPAAGAALATTPNHGTAVSTAAKAKAKPVKPGKKAKKVKASFVHAGTVTAVSPTSVTFTVHGGRNKALRGKTLVVTLTATTKVTRNDAAATIASVKVGDHVNAKGTKTGDVYTALRVSASGL